MPIDWDRDLLGPVHAVFGEAARYFPKAGPPIDLPDAVFDAESGMVEISPDGVPVTAFKPVLGVRSALLPNPEQFAVVEIPSAGQRFKVIDFRQDGHGEVKLILKVDSAL